LRFCRRARLKTLFLEKIIVQEKIENKTRRTTIASGTGLRFRIISHRPRSAKAGTNVKLRCLSFIPLSL
jgi:hypothetical protein